MLSIVTRFHLLNIVLAINEEILTSEARVCRKQTKDRRRFLATLMISLTKIVELGLILNREL